MLVFSISLKSQQVTKDWNYTCKLLERTLNSLYKQTIQEFKVVLVCHEKPDLEFSTNTIIHQVDFQPPRKVYYEMSIDRNLKELLGRQIAKEMDADYIMNIDADDCVNRHILEFINNDHFRQDAKDAYYIDKGYIYYEDIRKVVSRGGFYNFCGSTLVIRSSMCEVPKETDYSSLRKYIDNGYFLSGGNLLNAVKSSNSKVSSFPFHGCVYVRSAKDRGLATHKGIIASIQRRDVRMLLSPLKRNFEKITKAKYLNQNQSIEEEFGFYEIFK